MFRTRWMLLVALVSVPLVSSVVEAGIAPDGAVPMPTASTAPPATGAPVPAPTPGLTPQGDPRGLVLAGLKRVDGGSCGRLYQLDAPGLPPMCTHGPDPAPDGVDVRVSRDTAELSGTVAGDATAPCIGDGVSGPRVQAIYVVASDRVDRFATVEPLIAGWAGQMDQAVHESAAATGGERHIRFVTRANCTLDVRRVVLSSTGDDSIANTITELRSQGLSLTGRKYLIWADATVYCGIAQVTQDDRADSANAANTSTMYARVDTGCWGRSDHLSELHELMHTLGAVQLSAPHSSGGFHCTDESDVMCYADAAGLTMTYPCSSSRERLLDCRNDDYFHTAPPSGSYLATHWNTATSVFLHAGPVSGGSTGAPALSLARTASPTSVSAVGQTISYGYTVTNSGTASLGPVQITVSDTRVGGGSAFACGASSTTLAPGATVSCSASTTVMQADLDAGSITSSATASGGGLTSSAASLTITATAVAALSLARTASPASYGAAGETIVFGYVVSNAGTASLGPVQLTVSDSRIAAGAPFACGPSSTTLVPGQTVSCSGSATVTQADVDAGSFASTATASGGGVASAPVSLVIGASTPPPPPPPPATTSTSLSGSLSGKRLTRTFTVVVGEGTTSSALRFSPTGKTKSADTSLTLRILRADLTEVARATGPSVLRLATSRLPRGTFTWEVSGSTSASFTLEVAYTAP